MQLVRGVHKLGRCHASGKDGRKDRGFGVKMRLLGDGELKQTEGPVPSNSWVWIMAVEGDLDTSGDGTCIQVEKKGHIGHG